MEFLSINFEMEYVKGNITPIYKIEPMVTHLLYANDILIMAKFTTKMLIAFSTYSQNLRSRTGLGLNEYKSILFCSKGAKDKQQIADI